jgi:hypothetical protein
VTDELKSARLRLRVVSQYVKRGENIEAFIDATNVAETVVTLDAPDTAVISQPHTVIAGSGTFQRTIPWTVEHVQKETLVDITVSDGQITQIGQCKVVS